MRVDSCPGVYGRVVNMFVVFLSLSGFRRTKTSEVSCLAYLLHTIFGRGQTQFWASFGFPDGI